MAQIHLPGSNPTIRLQIESHSLPPTIKEENVVSNRTNRVGASTDNVSKAASLSSRPKSVSSVRFLSKSS